MVLGWGTSDPEAAARLVPVGLRRGLVEGHALLPVGAAAGLLAFGGAAAGGVPGLVVLAWLGVLVGALPAAVEVAGPAAPPASLLVLAVAPLLAGVVVAAAAGLRVPARALTADPPPLRLTAASASTLLVAAPLLVLGGVVGDAVGQVEGDARWGWALGGALAGAAYLGAAAAIGTASRPRGRPPSPPTAAARPAPA